MMSAQTKVFLLTTLTLSAGCTGVAPDDPDPSAEAYYSREYSNANSSTGANMTYNGGSVLTSNKTMAIFWGAWSNPGDKITGLDSFFSGFGGSGIAQVADQYSSITSSSTYLGHQLDTSAVPSKALTVAQAVAEGCKITGNNPDPSALYLIYTSTAAGSVKYCAWHSWGSCANGASIQVAYMPNIDGIAGCDPGDTSGLHSQGLAALANVTSHELMETITDPRGNAWYDSAGNEIGDKCAWAFDGLRTLTNGSQWLLQGEWSNSAYTAGAGFANTSGQKGCAN
jgi:hypothetical protein